MKIPLVGETYALRSPAAAVQQSINVFAQLIDDPTEHGKNRGILSKIPGYHLFATLAHIFCRGLWSGGGRLFAVGGSHLYEVGLGTYVGGTPSTGAGAILSDFDLGSNDGNPAQMFGNGNQLLIVANGFTYIDNGAGPVPCRFLLSGTVNTSGTAVTWVSGDQFTAAMVGIEITINGSQFQVQSVTDATHLVLTTTAGVQTGSSFSSAGGDLVTAVTGCYLDGYFIVQRPAGYRFSGTVNTVGTAVTYASGDTFSEVTAGDTIAINGVAYVVQTVNSAVSLTLLTSAGNQTGVSWGFGPDLGRQFNISAPGDGTQWDPLDFASKEGYADYLQSVFAAHEQLILFGTESTEFWQNTGNALFPFQRIPGALVKIGSVARFGPLEVADRVYFLGANSEGPAIAYRLNGFTPERISTHAIEVALSSGLANPGAAVGYGYIEDGHRFAVWNFLGNLHTLVWDEASSLWHTRANSTDGTTFNNYSPQFHAFVAEWGEDGYHIVGDYLSGKLWEQNLAYGDADGQDIGWSRTLPYRYEGGLRQFFGRMTLEMETGTAISGEPTVTRDYTDDRGATFINPAAVSYGAPGDKAKRVYWPASGSSYGRAFRLHGHGQDRLTLIDLDLEIEAGLGG